MHKSVGIVGVGLMGHGIAYNLVTKGYPVSLLDHAGTSPLQNSQQTGPWFTLRVVKRRSSRMWSSSA